MVSKFNPLTKAVLGLSLGAGLAFSQTTNINPAARVHVKVEGGKNVKYTSKLTKVAHLNFTMNFHHDAGKPLVTQALTRIAKAYAVGGVDAFTISTYMSGTAGTVKGEMPNFTLANMTDASVIIANNISGFGDNALGTARREAIQKAIETEGRGYLGIHGSGDESRTTWAWYSNTLHPMAYVTHGTRTTAPIYKHPAEAMHIVTQDILATKTTPATVPDELDAAGKEVLKTNVPTRAMKNEWYQFGRDISRTAAYQDKVTILTKYDPRNLGTALPAQYRRLGGNLYTYLYKVGAGLTSYLPAGHENDEVLNASTGFDGGAGDYDRYLAQLLFHLAGYNKTDCDASCNGLPIVDANNRLTGEVVSTTGTRFKTEPMNVSVKIDASKMSFSSNLNEKYSAVLTDLSGHVVDRKIGTGAISHEFDQSKLKSGVYFLKLQVGKSAPQTMRYAVLPSTL